MRRKKAEKGKKEKINLLQALLVSLYLGKTKTEQKLVCTYISSRKRGVCTSQRKDKKELIKRKNKPKKTHYHVNFTRSLQKVKDARALNI